MRIHILAICGKLMAPIAVLAKQLGHEVSGQDKGVYPPMSTMLGDQGITLTEGFEIDDLDAAKPDLVIIGNVASRGWPIVEHIMNSGIPYMSGSEWLHDFILKDRHVLAISGTHGKTTTTAMVAWMMTQAGKNPGYMVGGVPRNLPASSALGADYFVIEADEYDTAFFDKRSKFFHYNPTTLVMNNVEYDHGDIFRDLEAIQLTFHHLVRLVPSKGCVIVPTHDASIETTLAKGCWTPVVKVGTDGEYSAVLVNNSHSHFKVLHHGQEVGEVRWPMMGAHNVHNALAAIAAVGHVGVDIGTACAALCHFTGVRGRMEVRGTPAGVTVYDDYAHHPTEIATTLDGLRRKVGSEKIIVAQEPRSNTMRMGRHRESLVTSFDVADEVYLYAAPDMSWNLDTDVTQKIGPKAKTFGDIDVLAAHLCQRARSGNHIVVMSNSTFGELIDKLLIGLSEKTEKTDIAAVG